MGIHPTSSEMTQDVRQETEEIFAVFMDLCDEGEDMNPDDAPVYAQGLPFSKNTELHFGTDIEADSAGPESETASVSDSQTSGSSESMTAEDESSEYTKEKKEETIRNGRLLRELADEINRQYISSNPQVEDSLKQLTGQVMSAGVESAFQKSLDHVLDDFSKSTFQEDKYKVALIMLCTRQVLKATKTSVDVTEKVSKAVVNTAMDYISVHFPDWTKTFT